MYKKDTFMINQKYNVISKDDSSSNMIYCFYESNINY